MLDDEVAELVSRAANSHAIRDDAPIDAMISDGVRTRRQKKQAILGGAALTLFAIVSLGAFLGPAGLSDSSDEGSQIQTAGMDPALLAETWRGLREAGLTKATISDYLAEEPGVPLALPASLPRGYSWVGPDEGFSSNEVGSLTMRTSLFRPDDLSAQPPVWVCLQDRGADACRKGDTQLQRSIDSYDVRIVFGGGGQPAATLVDFWRDVAFTTDPETVDWLPN